MDREKGRERDRAVRAAEVRWTGDASGLPLAPGKCSPTGARYARVAPQGAAELVREARQRLAQLTGRDLAALETAALAGEPGRVAEARAAIGWQVAAIRQAVRQAGGMSGGGELEAELGEIGAALPAVEARAEALAGEVEGGEGEGEAAGPIGDIAKAGVRGASAPLPDAEVIQRAFGRHDVRRVRAVVGGVGAAAATAMGAAAYAVGERVAFARPPDLHTAAHEAAHVVQQRAGVSLRGGGLGEEGDDHEQHADRVADAVVAGRSAEAILDEQAPRGRARGRAVAVVQRKAEEGAPRPAAVYLHVNAAEARQEIFQHLRRVRWPEPHARLAWRERDGFVSALVAALDALLGSFDPAENLEKLAFPRRPLAAVDALRPASGDIDWRPAVGVAVGQSLEEAILGSLARLGPRWLGAAERAHGPLAGAGVAVAYESLVTSHWMDRAVGRAMCAPGVFDVRAGAAVAAGAGAPLRPVALEWQGARSPRLWNFVRAVEPADATVEEVAAQLFADSAPDAYGEPASFLAYSMVAIPPLFGLPPRMAESFPAAAVHREGSGPAVDETFGAQVRAVAESALVDEIALAQARAVERGPARRGEILETLQGSAAQATHLIAALAPWGLAGPVGAALGWIHGKELELAAAGDETVARFAPVVRGQKARLHDIGGLVVEIDRAAASLGIGDRSGGEAAPLRDVLHTCAHAAAASHLLDTSQRLLEQAARQQARLPLRAVQATSRELAGSVAMLADASRPDDETARGLQEDAHGIDLRARDLSSRLMAGGAPSAAELDDLAVAAGEVALKSRLHALAVEIGGLEEAARAARDGFTGEMAASFSSDFGGLETACAMVRFRLEQIGRRMDGPQELVAASDCSPEERAEVVRRSRRMALEKGRARFAELARERDLAGFLQRGARLVEAQAFRVACIKVAALVGVSLVAGAVGGMVARAAATTLTRAGAAPTLVTLARGAAFVATDASVSAAGQTLIFGDPVGEALLENALTSAAGMALLKPVGSGLAKLRALDLRSAALWKRVGSALVLSKTAAIGGHAILGAGLGYASHRIVTGESAPPPATAREWILQGASIALGRKLGGDLDARLTGLRRLDVPEARPLVEAGERLTRRAARLEAEPDPARALELLDDHVQLLRDEADLLASLVKDGSRSGRRELAGMKRAVDAELATGREGAAADLALHLAGLEELIPGAAWRGSRAEIERAIASISAADPAARAVRAPSGLWQLTRAGRSIAIHERPPTAEEAEGLRARARAAIAFNRRRSEELAALLERGTGPVRTRHLTIGAGTAATLAHASLPSGLGRGVMPGETLDRVPDSFAIARAPDWLQQLGDREFGQPVTHHRSSAYRHQPGDFNPDHASKGRASDIAHANALTAHDTGMVVYPGTVTHAEPRAPGPGWEAPELAWRVKVDRLDRWIYAETIDLAAGLGAPRAHPAFDDALRAQLGARIVDAQNHLDPPIARGTLAVVGDSGTALFAAENALDAGLQVILIARDGNLGQIRSINPTTVAAVLARGARVVPGEVTSASAASAGAILLTVSGSAHPLPVDAVSLAIGQQASLPAGLERETLRAQNIEVRPIRRTVDGQDRVVGLEAVDRETGKPLGLRLQGAVITTDPAKELVADKYERAFARDLHKQATDANVPDLSRGVEPAIYQSAINIPLTNE